MQQMTRNGCSMFIECCWDRDLSELSGGMHLDTGSSSANCTFSSRWHMIQKLAQFSFLLFDDFTTIHNGILIVQ